MSRESSEGAIEDLETQENQIKDYLKTLPYEMILKQRVKAQQKLRRQQQWLMRQKRDSHRPRPQLSGNVETEDKRDKEAPVEKSVKIKVNRLVRVFDQRKRSEVDPRFEQYTGKLNPEGAKRAYHFIEDLQHNEKRVLRKSLASKKLSQSQREILSQRYNDVTSSIQVNKDRVVEQAVSKQHRQELSGQFRQGKTPFFKSKRIMKEDVQRHKLEGMSKFQIQRMVNQKRQQVNSKMVNRKYQYQGKRSSY